MLNKIKNFILEVLNLIIKDLSSSYHPGDASPEFFKGITTTQEITETNLRDLASQTLKNLHSKN